MVQVNVLISIRIIYHSLAKIAHTIQLTQVECTFGRRAHILSLARIYRHRFGLCARGSMRESI